MSSQRERSLSRRATNMEHRIPYVDIIARAISESPGQRLTAKEIFDYVSARFGPMKSATTLKNTIRHTLTRYKVFRKVQRGKHKKPNWWEVVVESGSDQQVQVQRGPTPPSTNYQHQQEATLEIPRVNVPKKRRPEVVEDDDDDTVPAYCSNQPPVQLPQFFQSRMLQAYNDNNCIAYAHWGRKDAANTYSSDCRLPRLNDAVFAGAGQSEVAEQVPYLFLFRGMTASTVTNGTTMFTTSAPTPIPEYYQM